MIKYKDINGVQLNVIRAFKKSVRQDLTPFLADFIVNNLGFAIGQYPNILKDMFLSGGSFPTFYHDSVINDYDIYFKNSQTRDLFIEDITSSRPYATYLGHSNERRPVTIVHRDEFIGTPKEVLNTFDYVHCRWYYCLSSNTFYISKKTMHYIDKRLLKRTESNCTNQSRREKWLNRGYLDDLY